MNNDTTQLARSCHSKEAREEAQTLFELGMKRCYKCKQVKPLDDFSPSNHRHGRGSYCRVCVREKETQKRREQGMQPQKRVVIDGKKRCSTCGEWKEMNRDNFYYSRTTKSGFHQDCITCSHNKSIERNRKQGRFDVRRRYKDGMKQCTHCLEWFPANTDNFIKHTRTLDGLYYYCKTCDSALRKLHRHKYKAHDHNRRARQNELPNDYTIEDWQFALDYFEGKCAVCGRYPDFWNVLAQDHWIPLSDARDDNPGTVAWNIIPLCHSKKDGIGGCNQQKKDNDPLEWLLEDYGSRKGKQIYQRIQDYLEIVRKRKSGE